jgi:hypothetical protein
VTDQRQESDLDEQAEFYDYDYGKDDEPDAADDDDDPPPYKKSLDYRLGYSDGYRQAMDYVSANVRNAVFAYELNRRVKSFVMGIRWRWQRFYYRTIRPNDIPF